MIIELCRTGIEILPENEQDVCYINDTLGLTKPGDSLEIIRYHNNFMGIKQEEEKPGLKKCSESYGLCLGVRIDN